MTDASKRKYSSINKYISAISPYVVDSGFKDADLIHQVEQKLTHDMRLVSASADPGPPKTWAAYQDWIIKRENCILAATGKLLSYSATTSKD